MKGNDLFLQERKREENLRRKEEERKLREQEKQRELENQNKKMQEGSTVESQENASAYDAETVPQSAVINPQRVKVNFNDEESGSLKKKRAKRAKAESVENERRKAEEKLQRRIKRAQDKKKSEPKSYAGFTDLEGEILHINVTKVVKKLGIAIDGGANTKQKAVIIREISVSMNNLSYKPV